MMKRITLILILMVSVAFAEEKFAIPQPGYAFEFPRDHGSHPEFRIEWWYITGHLFSESKLRFGFQATFFRIRQSEGETELHMAHMAVSDPASGRFLHEERLNRTGWDAYAKVGDLDLRNGNWTLKLGDSGAMSLVGSVQAKAGLSLELKPGKGHVIFGENGVSRKGGGESSASYYITFPRLEVSGVLRMDGEDVAVSGMAWMDHEISSSQLDRNQVGWDWIQIQFKDGREMMAFVLREKDGKMSPFSTVNWVDESGTIVVQKADAFSWEPGGDWTSAETGAVYPTSPTIRARDPKTGSAILLVNRPTMKAQEMTGKIGGVSYWEGAGDVIDGAGNVVGTSFLELTGYVGDLGEKLR
jgi:predicted secreted hydrolase